MHREHIRFQELPDKYLLFVLLMAKGEKPQ